MQKSLFAASLGVALLVPLAVPLAAHAEGSYVGINVGESTYDQAGENESKTLVGLSYGTVINPNFDIEAGYLRHGKIKATDPVSGDSGSFDTQSLYLAAIGKLPVADGFHAFGKAGVAVHYSDASLTTGGTTISDSETKVGPMIGIGVSYQFTQAFSGVLEYQYFDKIIDDGPKLSSWSVGARYHF